MIEPIDFLVIGAGIAGLSTAIALEKYGKVLILHKRTKKDSNTYYAAGGIAVSGLGSDLYEEHIQDTLIAGDGLCKENVVREIITKGTNAVKELIQWGAEFDKTKSGKYDLGKEGGHHSRRVLHAGDLTGQEIIKTLIEKAKRSKNITFRANQIAINLIEKQGVCAGVYVLDNKTQKIYAIRAKATILATGGLGKVFLYTSNPDVASGDGDRKSTRLNSSHYS